MSARQAAARAVKLPASLRPMLAVAGELPQGDDWNFELKWDGVRALGFVEDGLTHLVSRSGRDLTDTYRELADGAPLDEPTALVDGEVVALDGEGRPSFQGCNLAKLPGEADGRCPRSRIWSSTCSRSGHALLWTSPITNAGAHSPRLGYGTRGGRYLRRLVLRARTCSRRVAIAGSKASSPSVDLRPILLAGDPMRGSR